MRLKRYGMIICSVLMMMGMLRGLQADTVSPGLFQWYFVVPNNSQQNIDRYTRDLFSEGVSGPVRVPGVIAADSASNTFRNPYQDNLMYGWSDYGCYVYQGEIYLEAGTTYTFCVGFDDGAAVNIDGNFVVETPQGSSGWNSSWTGSITPTETGWKPLTVYVWDWAGSKNKNASLVSGVQWTTSTDTSELARRSDATVWNRLVEPGDGSGEATFLRFVMPDIITQHLTIEANVAELASFLSPEAGTYEYQTAMPQETQVCTAPKTLVAVSGGWEILGYSLQTSQDAGVTWSAPVTNFNATSYTFVATEGQDEKLTWLYQSVDLLPSVAYVDCEHGNDANPGTEAAPIRTLEPLLTRMGSHMTIYLSEGVHILEQTLTLRELEQVQLIGAGKDKTFIEPVVGGVFRPFHLQQCAGVSFEGITFRKGNYTDTRKTVSWTMGGVFLIEASEEIAFVNCDFRENCVTTASGSTWGGVMATSNAYVRVNDCVFESNRLDSVGTVLGGLFAAFGSNPNYGIYGGIAVTNAIIRYNWTSSQSGGTLCGAFGTVMYGGSRTKSDFYNCLVAYNDMQTQKVSAMGRAIFLIGEAVNSNFDIGDAVKHEVISVRRSTMAYNFAQEVFTSTRGKLYAEGCISTRQRNLCSRWQGNVTLKDCYYDRPLQTLPSSSTNLTLGDAQLLPDLSVPADSPAYGLGYTPTEPSTAGYRTLYVDATAVAGGNGQTEATAFDTLTAALAVARDGDTIRVAPGTYTATRESFPIRLENRQSFAIIGSGRDTTFFEPGESGYDGNFMVATNVFRVALKDFTVRGFNTTANISEPSAIGIYSGIDVEVSGVDIEGCNKAPADRRDVKEGTHFLMRHGVFFRFKNNRIRNNTALTANNRQINGGGAYFTGGYGIIEGSEFTGNASAAKTVYGLGIQVDSGHDGNGARAHWELRNCLIANNTTNALAGFISTVNGTAIASYGGQSVLALQNCTLVGTLENRPLISMNEPHGKCIAENCIFSHMGSGFAITANGRGLYHCVIETNETVTEETLVLPTGAVSDMTGKSYGVPTGNVFVSDIKFRGADRGNYHLKADSPAVDLGTLIYFMTPGTIDPYNVEWVFDEEPVDGEGNPRVMGAAPDAGFFERNPKSSTHLIVR